MKLKNPFIGISFRSLEYFDFQQFSNDAGLPIHTFKCLLHQFFDLNLLGKVSHFSRSQVINVLRKAIVTLRFKDSYASWSVRSFKQRKRTNFE